MVIEYIVLHSLYSVRGGQGPLVTYLMNSNMIHGPSMLPINEAIVRRLAMRKPASQTPSPDSTNLINMGKIHNDPYALWIQSYNRPED